MRIPHVLSRAWSARCTRLAQEFKADTVREWFWEPEVLRKYYPSSFFGRDKVCLPSLPCMSS